MEIERKWLVSKLPDFAGIKPVRYERYFLFRGKGVEMRIQKKGDSYEFERKEEKSALESAKQKFTITKDEFEHLKKSAIGELVRDGYQMNKPVSIKVYRGKYEGLVRAEVEFNSVDEAKKFKPLTWFGAEITKTQLGKDSRLLDLSESEFKSLLKSLTK